MTRAADSVNSEVMGNTKKVCRQVAWQDRRRAAHECVICGTATKIKPEGGYYVLCETHRMKQKQRYRAVQDAAKAYWLAKGQGKL